MNLYKFQIIPRYSSKKIKPLYVIDESLDGARDYVARYIREGFTVGKISLLGEGRSNRLFSNNSKT